VATASHIGKPGDRQTCSIDPAQAQFMRVVPYAAIEESLLRAKYAQVLAKNTHEQGRPLPKEAASFEKNSN
jgi:hypothetical protein